MNFPSSIPATFIWEFPGVLYPGGLINGRLFGCCLQLDWTITGARGRGGAKEQKFTVWVYLIVIIRGTSSSCVQYIGSLRSRSTAPKYKTLRTGSRENLGTRLLCLEDDQFAVNSSLFIQIGILQSFSF